MQQIEVKAWREKEYLRIVYGLVTQETNTKVEMTKKYLTMMKKIKKNLLKKK